MQYLLDSDWIADLLAERGPAADVVSGLFEAGIAISTVSYLEVLEGVLGGRTPDTDLVGFERFAAGVTILPFGEQEAVRAARIRLELRRQRRQVNHRALDLLIAATAIEHGLGLVTRNVRDYADIPGVQLVDIAESG